MTMPGEEHAEVNARATAAESGQAQATGLATGATADQLTKTQEFEELVNKRVQSLLDKRVSEALKTHRETIRKELEKELIPQLEAQLRTRIVEEERKKDLPLEEQLSEVRAALAQKSMEHESILKEYEALEAAIKAIIEAESEELPEDVYKTLTSDKFTLAQKLILLGDFKKLIAAGGVEGGSFGRATQRARKPAPPPPTAPTPDKMAEELFMRRHGNTQANQVRVPEVWRNR